ncbi:hypothetical protein ATCV1_z038R [Acanthocystis turfacea chlorella virus 1]|uniref:Uncharacterized protein z038R n=1 Tax=Chlorovirus heliozoae TaxID=322019 RepID=A7K7Z8_9PHYC|nr:hypothetical protein ATCV1_z038R [Acanthocystis turfacea chlorella virus 1]ABT16172.1 hypothetical protein ATCV1_z038R [Acanthocystis turfacea chlorella virus 1]
MPSLPAKKPRMCLMKWRSSSFSFSRQSTTSWLSWTSSTVQKVATAFLYIWKMSGYRMGNAEYLRAPMSARRGSTWAVIVIYWQYFLPDVYTQRVDMLVKSIFQK